MNKNFEAGEMSCEFKDAEDADQLERVEENEQMVIACRMKER